MMDKVNTHTLNSISSALLMGHGNNSSPEEEQKRQKHWTWQNWAARHKTGEKPMQHPRAKPGHVPDFNQMKILTLLWSIEHVSSPAGMESQLEKHSQVALKLLQLI